MLLPGWRKSWTKCSIVPHAGARIYSLIRDNENSLGIRGNIGRGAERTPKKAQGGGIMNDADKEKLNNIIKKYNGKEGFLIQLLLDLQGELNWISKEAIGELSQKLKIPASQIFRVASFYKAMNLSPVGRHKVCVCMGTACQVRGAQRLLDTTESKLGIKSGQTTPDNSFTLDRVNCLGCCAIGPVIVVNDDYHGRVDSKKVEKILGKLALE